MLDLENQEIINEGANLYPFEEETNLLNSVMKGDSKKAKQQGTIFFRELSKNREANLTYIKSCTLHLTVVLVRNYFQIGAEIDKLLDANMTYVFYLEKANSINEIQELLLSFIQYLIINVHVDNNAATEKSELVRKAKAYIDNNYQRPVTLQEVAAYLHLSPCYFSRLFSEVSELTFQEYLTHVRINAAQRLLQKKKLTLEEIAYQVGYNDVSYFIRVFKKVTGVTPRQYNKDLNCPKQRNLSEERSIDIRELSCFEMI